MVLGVSKIIVWFECVKFNGCFQKKKEDEDMIDQFQLFIVFLVWKIQYKYEYCIDQDCSYYIVF